MAAKGKFGIRPKAFFSTRTLGLFLPNIFLECLYFVAIIGTVLKIVLKKICIARFKTEIKVKTIADQKSYIHPCIHPLCSKLLCSQRVNS